MRAPFAADTGYGRLGLGRFDAGECAVTQQLIGGGEERTSHLSMLLCTAGAGKALGDPISVGFVGDLFVDGWEVILAVGMLNMGQKCTALSGQGHAPTQQVGGRTPLGWGEPEATRGPTAAQQHSDFLGVDLVVFGLAAPWIAFHRGGHDRGQRAYRVQPRGSASPVPRKQAFGSEDDLSAVGGNGFEKRLWGGWHVTVQQRFASLVEDAHVHGAGMEIDTPGKGVLLRVKSHEVSSSLCVREVSRYQHTTVVCWGGGLNKYQPSGADGPQRTFFGYSCIFSCGPQLTASVDMICIANDCAKRIWLNMRSGELREQDLEQGSQQRFPSSSHVVHKLKEAQIQWQVVL